MQFVSIAYIFQALYDRYKKIKNRTRNSWVMGSRRLFFFMDHTVGFRSHFYILDFVEKMDLKQNKRMRLSQWCRIPYELPEFLSSQLLFQLVAKCFGRWIRIQVELLLLFGDVWHAACALWSIILKMASFKRTTHSLRSALLAHSFTLQCSALPRFAPLNCSAHSLAPFAPLRSLVCSLVGMSDTMVRRLKKQLLHYGIRPSHEWANEWAERRKARKRASERSKA